MGKTSLKDRNKILILITLSLGLTVGSLNFGLLEPSLTIIQQTLNVNERIVIWVLNAYVLFYLLGAIITARLSDKYGRKNIYLFNMSCFAISTILIFFSWSFYSLLLARILQGLFIGGTYPISTTIIGDVFPKKERGIALGIISSFFGIFFLAGPNLGYLVTNLDWKIISLINIPLIIIILVLTYYFLPNIRLKSLKSLDMIGIIFLGIFVFFLALGLGQINTNQLWDSLKSNNVLIPFLISFIFFILLYLREKRFKYPLIVPEFISRKNILITIILCILSGGLEMGFIFLPTYFNLNYPISSFWTILIPSIPIVFLSSIMVGYLLDKLPSKIVVLINGILAFSGYILAIYNPENIFIFILGVIMIAASFSGFSGALLRHIMLNSTKISERAFGQSLVAINKNIGRLIGTALFGAILISQKNILVGYHNAYMIMLILAILISIISLFLNRDHKKYENI